jgi:hypothetical protein
MTTHIDDADLCTPEWHRSTPSPAPITRPCRACTHPQLPALCRHCGCRMTHHPDQQQGAHLMCSIRAAR